MFQTMVSVTIRPARPGEPFQATPFIAVAPDECPECEACYRQADGITTVCPHFVEVETDFIGEVAATCSFESK